MVVAMSGGVDSSVAAQLLVEQGYDVVGLFMRVGAKSDAAVAPPPLPRGNKGGSFRTSNFELGSSKAGATGSLLPVLPQVSSRSHQGCCSAADAADARFVSGMLGIPFYALNFQEDFDGIINYFADEYAKGRTPNPCVVCNDRLKFGRLFEYADAVGAKYVATGHYARVGAHDGQPALLRAVDTNKDQTYVLFGLRRELLSRILFPIGHLTKPEVRAVAARMGFPNHDKPDSVEICFAPDRDYARVVRERRPDAFVGGEIVDAAGSVIGRHDGLANYTVGQRRGLRIAAGKPIYVTQLDVLNNRVVTGDDQALLCDALIADRANILLDPSVETFRADVKIRYLHPAASATVQRLPQHRVRVIFDDPQRAVTPGQAVVFYDGDTVLGGAWIERGEPITPRARQETTVA